MTQGFDREFWESHWREAGGREVPAHPYLARETHALVPGTALDAGCGEGAEALWLADAGWQVTAVDISAEALVRARARGAGIPAGARVDWVAADLGAWQPDGAFDLVTTHYAHPAMDQLSFYERISGWVAPGGTLLVVGHLRTHDAEDHSHGHSHGHGHGHPPEEASVTAADITARLDHSRWEVVTAEEPVRTVGDGTVTLRDVVVRATRRA